MGRDTFQEGTGTRWSLIPFQFNSFCGSIILATLFHTVTKISSHIYNIILKRSYPGVHASVITLFFAMVQLHEGSF